MWDRRGSVIHTDTRMKYLMAAKQQKQNIRGSRSVTRAVRFSRELHLQNEIRPHVVRGKGEKIVYRIRGSAKAKVCENANHGTLMTRNTPMIQKWTTSSSSLNKSEYVCVCVTGTSLSLVFLC